MKILLVHNNYQSKFIGGEDVVFQRESAALKGILGDSNVLEYVVYNDDIKIINLFFTIWFSRKHYRNIYKLVKDNSIDLIHVHNFYPLLTLSIFKAAKKAGAKTINTLHSYRFWCISGIFYRRECGICELCAKKKFAYPGIFYKCYRNSYLQSLVTALAFYFYKKSNQTKYVDKFFALTELGRKKVIELGISEKKVLLKPNFVEINDLGSNIKKDFIYVGKLDASKGVLELLKTWMKLDSKYILRLIGQGELDKELDAFKADNIIFLGKLDNNIVLREIAKSKYLISPSIMYETFGLTIIEAMSQGVPVIGFNIGTRPEFIKDGENGFIAEVDGLKEVIERAYRVSNYEELSINAKMTAKNFSQGKIMDDQIMLYKKIIDNII